MLSSTLFCLLLSVFFVSGHLLTDDRTTRRPRKGDPEERRKMKTRIQSRQQRSVGSQDDNECQEGDPLGESYSGRMNVTTSGRTCQVGRSPQICTVYLCVTLKNQIINPCSKTNSLITRLVYVPTTTKTILGHLPDLL